MESNVPFPSLVHRFVGKNILFVVFIAYVVFTGSNW